VQKATRIQDVARAAGVSTATVSRALSSPDLLSEATRKLVLEAIRSTGYRANKAARTLRTQKAGAVLVLVPNLGNPFFSKILASLSDEFMGTEYSVLIADTEEHPPCDRNLIDYFRDSRIDGMISLDGALTRQEMRDFHTHGVDDRIVFACEWVSDSNIPSVRSDIIKGARLAVRHLHELGHRKIAHVVGPEDNVLSHARRQGALEAFSQLGLQMEPQWMIRGDFSLECGRAAARQILAMDDRPTAVCCSSDQVAFGLISTLTAEGVTVPEDISVVGFDDIELSEYYVPALTTVRQNRAALGGRAATLLMERLAPSSGAADLKHKPGGALVMVDVELVVRESTAAPKA
jgi:LacI family transcriptional regulator, repressor for deo operon, udp, cdd, tsx, nupC, and nupG